MDINSLLSPSPAPDSRESTPQTPRQNPPPGAAQRSSPRSPTTYNAPAQTPGHPVRPPTYPRKSSGLSQQVNPNDHKLSPASSPSHAHAQPRLYARDQRPSLPSIAAYNSAAAAAATRPHLDHRASSSVSMPPSTTGMDALAEVALRQHPQPFQRPSVDHRSSSSGTPGAQTPQRPSVDAIISDSQSRTPPPPLHSYQSSALSASDSETLARRAQQLQTERLNLAAHVEFNTLLHNGFVAYTQAGKDPQTYELLHELRQSREFMDESIPVGEAIWAQWLMDERVLARSFDDRFKVMELHARSVQEEPYSAPLWTQYGDFMKYLYNCAHGIEEDSTWTAEDRAVAAQVFPWEKMMEVWEAGIANTRSHINDSNLVWDRYIELLTMDQASRPSPQKVEQLKGLFVERLLREPHTTWSDTFSAFSTLISTYDPANYEEIMVSMNSRSEQVKKSYEIREPYEFKVQKALESGDKEAEYNAYVEYLNWELRMKGVFSEQMIISLYERATTRFHTDATFWNDYIEFIIESGKTGPQTNLISVLERATRHCPWSGDLWSHRIIAMEADNMSFQDVEGVKHVATASLQVDKTGLEDLLKVYIAWCGYLRRRAVLQGSSEDDMDVAEVGIRSALENYRKAGEKLMGEDFVPDPQYRLERIHIKVLFSRGDPQGCRAIWNGLIASRGGQYDFWYRYYIWSMVVWGQIAIQSTPAAVAQLHPLEPTQILRQGLKHLETMDMPEQLVDMFLNHCEQHESVEEYRKAMIEARQAKKRVTERRQKEYQDQWNAYYQKQAAEQAATQQPQENGKRKREEEEAEAQAQKKLRSDAEVVSADADEGPKRDREHTVVIVKNIPKDATELQVRGFFRDCGTINTISLKPANETQTATIEFETKEDALYAQTKVTKPFQGAILEIEFATGATLWVTNYPPSADEKYIRNLFKDCGEITQVRFPSLQANTNRRFCYVQFVNALQAEEAAKLDGKLLDGHLTLTAKISDPSRKEDRQGALYEGREVYVRNIHWGATEDDVQRLFAEHGPVERVRIPRNMAGKSKGVAFVVFADKNDAAGAVAALDNTPFRNRTINVEASVAKAKRTVTNIAGRDTASAEPPESDAMSVDDADKPTTAAEGATARSRTIALLNVPDTVNAARLQALVAPFGAVRKLTLRPDHAGAVVEFADEASVGKAGLGLEGTLLEGNKVRVGSFAELMRQKPESRAGRIGEKRKDGGAVALGGKGAPVRRPAQKGRVGLKKFVPRANGGGEVNGEKTEGGKSNAQFRELFLKGKGGGEEKEGSAQAKEE